MHEVRFAFGREGLEVRLPDGPEYWLVEGRSATALPDLHAELERALDAPHGCAPLLELARGKQTAAISVCDITRPAPNRVTLPPILQRLHEAGIPPERVTILIATGLHRPATAAEIVQILGPEIAANYQVVNNHARVESEHRFLGMTGRGTPVWIDERFMAAELKITLGFIEQHLMLGFSGGRKLVAPGLAAEATIKTIHSPRFMREPRATEGSTEDNPLHAELIEIARRSGHDFLLDVTLTRDRQVSGVFAGDLEAAHAAGVAFVRETGTTVLPVYADAVMTSAAGFPLDLTFYQIVKGITAASHLVKPGGPILIVAECAEGAGSEEFAEMLAEYGGHEDFLLHSLGAAVRIDQWQLEKLALVQRRNPVLFYVPGVGKAALGRLGESSFGDADSAVEAMLAMVPGGAKVAVVPEGPYVFARVGD